RPFAAILPETATPHLPVFFLAAQALENDSRIEGPRSLSSRLWGNSLGDVPENRTCGLLNGFQALAQELCISLPEMDVVLRSGSGFKPDGLANYERHGFGLGFPYLLAGESTALSAMQHFVSDLMHQG